MAFGRRYLAFLIRHRCVRSINKIQSVISRSSLTSQAWYHRTLIGHAPRRTAASSTDRYTVSTPRRALYISTLAGIEAAPLSRAKLLSDMP